MTTTRFFLLLSSIALGACGGATAGDGDGGGADGSISDAHGGDSAFDAGCPPGTLAIPDAAVYSCDAAGPGQRGCRAAGQDPNGPRDPNRYPVGCVVHLPSLQGGCSGACCGPQECTCQDVPFDGGPQFECPL